MVLRVDGKVSNPDGIWYRVAFDDQKLEHPDRVKTDWFVHKEHVALSYEPGVRNTWEDDAPTTTSKRIVIDISEQQLVAYENGEQFLATPVSTGLELSPTSIGEFRVFKKMPSRYMQGPIEDSPVNDFPPAQ